MDRTAPSLANDSFIDSDGDGEEATETLQKQTHRRSTMRGRRESSTDDSSGDECDSMESTIDDDQEFGSHKSGIASIVGQNGPKPEIPPLRLEFSKIDKTRGLAEQVNIATTLPLTLALTQ